MIALFESATVEVMLNPDGGSGWTGCPMGQPLRALRDDGGRRVPPCLRTCTRFIPRHAARDLRRQGGPQGWR
ncbi:hypothetical protein DSL92_06840 [Billgrantia gudaonensis]|uniref:Uncharacterized protein n=1 Tax=Billgrantia gudaonensis TaxID=376427 RepID=A0A432JIJ3_9GAMM|nr:hypothetical protein DSL92_06840 [Halomonas gudaonensis]